ncbi:MAG TPA: DUF998 domain-containing protein [Ktedonobacteraceae bacterium]|nr:DUF998 domain-containing protein [Ktedonobacteraceae bacterium]
MFTTENSQTQNYSKFSRFLVACGAFGPIFFILVFLVEGATRPGYSAWHNFVSSLSLSDQGWMQIANFLICGSLVLLFAIGFRQVLQTGRGSVGGPLLLGIFGFGLIIAGLFVTDPSLSYPMGTHGNGPQTLHGTIHGVAGLICFSSVAIASFVMARRFAGDPAWKGWALYSTITGIVVLAFFVASLAVAVLEEHAVLANAPVGLFQRIAIIAGWGWISVVALRVLSQMHSSSSAYFAGEAGV